MVEKLRRGKAIFNQMDSDHDGFIDPKECLVRSKVSFMVRTWSHATAVFHGMPGGDMVAAGGQIGLVAIPCLAGTILSSLLIPEAVGSILAIDSYHPI